MAGQENIERNLEQSTQALDVLVEVGEPEGAELPEDRALAFAWVEDDVTAEPRDDAVERHRVERRVGGVARHGVRRHLGRAEREPLAVVDAVVDVERLEPVRRWIDLVADEA